MTCPVLLEIVSAPSTALARPINAPVSSSCNLAVSAFFPQTPAFPVPVSYTHLVFLCGIFFIKIIQRQESGAAYGLPVRWMDILTLQEDTASVRARVKECALRYYIKLQIIRKDLDIICVSAVDVVKMSVRNIFPMLHAFRN